MNRKVITYILAYVLRLEAILLLLPGLVGILYREKNTVYFFIVAVIVFIPGFLLTIKKPDNFTLYLKDGCVATALSWILICVTGCLPFYISGEIPSYIDALFETVSGFTTTGSSILTSVEDLSYCMIFWRSFTHWIGGMGVLVFLLSIISMSGGSHFNLMKAESPGPTVGKLVPKVKYTARLLYMIYTGMTIIQIILLLIGGMDGFDAVTITFGTAGTGGFAVKNDGCAGYTPYCQWVIGIFMMLFGVNFTAYYLLIFRKIKSLLKVEEVKYYFLIIAASTAFIFVNIYDKAKGVELTLRESFFQVSSIITTTGYSSTDFDMWPTLSKCVLVIIMFVGACAGSTGGGIKVSRILIAIRSIKCEINTYIHPKSIQKVKMDGKNVDNEVVRSILVYISLFFILFTLSVFGVCIEGRDLVTSFTAVAATINNIGPGLGMCGPAANFGFFTDLSKIIMIFDMLAGRLELYPLLLLFNPSIWKEMSKTVQLPEGNKQVTGKIAKQ